VVAVGADVAVTDATGGAGVIVATAVGAVVAVGGRGVWVAGIGVGVLVGGAGGAGGGSVAVAVGATVGVSDAQISAKRIAGNRPTVVLLTLPQTQASTSPSRIVRLELPELEYFQRPAVVRFQ
jgi:hypothetical protein